MKLKRTMTCGILFSTLFWICCSSNKSMNSDVVVLDHVTVVVGDGTDPLPHHRILLRGERIVSIGSVDHLSIPRGAKILDLAGRFVVPGFVDLHVHFPSDASVHQAMLDRLLEYGVTTILNPGARPGAGVGLRERIRQGESKGPRMFTAGPIIDQKPTGEGLSGWATEVETEKEIRAAVREQALKGVDFIKLYRRLPLNLVAAAMDEARKQEVPVVGHMGATTWTEAASLGIHMLVHSGWGTPMDEIVNLENPGAATDRQWYQAYADAPSGERFAALVATLVENKVFVVPTLSITQASGLGKDASMLPLFQVELAPDAHVADWWSEGWQKRHPQYQPDSEEEARLLETVYFPGVLGIVRAYYQGGVRLGVGTDVGNSWMTPGVVYHHELGLYQEAGIPPLEILKMATHNGADSLGILKDVGTLQEGKYADLIVLGSDPTKDISNTKDIEMVFLNGKSISFEK